MARDKKKVIEVCDRLWSRLVRERDKGRCQRCGAPTEGHAHHAVMRRCYMNTRWNLVNGVYLCGVCHVGMHENPAHSALFVIEKIGVRKAEEIMRLAREQKHWGIRELEEMERGLKAQIR